MVISRRLMLLAAAAALVVGAVAAMVPGPGGRVADMPRFNTLDSPSGAAIKGYDPVAYFVEGAPTLGLQQFSLEHGSVRWLFASAANKAKFEKDPAKYTPAFGGYCAYGVAQGYLVKVEPDAWSIRDGRLYLNYDAGVQQLWNKDWQGFVDIAEKKWPALMKKS